jgi:hypothetical protein
MLVCEKQGDRAINTKDLVAHYLTDNEQGMKNLITWFLNEVMQKEAARGI